MEKSYFDLILDERFKEAYDVANKAFEKESDKNDLRARADASMFLKDYKNALIDYLELIRITDLNYKSDGEYIDAGIAYWIIGDKAAAVSMWKEGLDKSVKRTSNIINVPAILYFASASQGDKRLLTLANKYLKRRWKSKIALAGFLLNELSLDELLFSVTKEPTLRERQLCKIYFYIAAKCLMDNDFNNYGKYLNKCIEIKGRFLEFEYHLAVGELDKMSKRDEFQI